MVEAADATTRDSVAVDNFGVEAGLAALDIDQTAPGAAGPPLTRPRSR